MRKTRQLVWLIVGAAILLGIGAVSAYASLADDSTPPVTTSDALSSYWGDATVTLSATDAEGVAYIYYEIDGGIVELYTVAAGNPQRSVTIIAPAAAGSASHVLRFWAQDTAGNVETANVKTLEVRTDPTAPVTVASGATAGAWYNAALVVHLVAADEVGGSGVATITSTLDGGVATVASAATTDVSIAVDTVGHANDGTRTLTYQAADMVGNVESLQTLAVNIDTVKPAPTAPSSASARRGRSATLKYSVADALPNGGTATVVIKIKNSAGTVVKTLNVGNVAVNTARTKTFTVPRTWRIGTYRFYVYATDTAQNTQVKVAWNRLFVK